MENTGDVGTLLEGVATCQIDEDNAENSGEGQGEVSDPSNPESTGAEAPEIGGKPPVGRRVVESVGSMLARFSTQRNDGDTGGGSAYLEAGSDSAVVGTDGSTGKRIQPENETVAENETDSTVKETVEKPEEDDEVELLFDGAPSDWSGMKMYDGESETKTKQTKKKSKTPAENTGKETVGNHQEANDKVETWYVGVPNDWSSMKMSEKNKLNRKLDRPGQSSGDQMDAFENEDEKDTEEEVNEEIEVPGHTMPLDWSSMKLYDGEYDAEWVQNETKKLRKRYGNTIEIRFNNQAKLAYFCTVCQAEMNSKAALDSHFEGQKHKKKVIQLKLGVGNEDENWEDPLKKFNKKTKLNRYADDSSQNDKDGGKKTPYFHKVPGRIRGGDYIKKFHTATGQTCYYCHVCQYEFPTKAKADEHMWGAKHAKKVMNNNAAVAKSFGPFIKTKYVKEQGNLGFYCELCDATPMTVQSLDFHCKGVKHLKQIADLQIKRGEFCEFITPWFSYGKRLFYCELCELEIGDRAEVNFHAIHMDHLKRTSDYLRGEEVQPAETGQWDENFDHRDGISGGMLEEMLLRLSGAAVTNEAEALLAASVATELIKLVKEYADYMGDPSTAAVLWDAEVKMNAVKGVKSLKVGGVTRPNNPQAKLRALHGRLGPPPKGPPAFANPRQSGPFV